MKLGKVLTVEVRAEDIDEKQFPCIMDRAIARTLDLDTSSIRFPVVSSPVMAYVGGLRLKLSATAKRILDQYDEAWETSDDWVTQTDEVRAKLTALRATLPVTVRLTVS